MQIIIFNAFKVNDNKDNQLDVTQDNQINITALINPKISKSKSGKYFMIKCHTKMLIVIFPPFLSVLLRDVTWYVANLYTMLIPD